MKYKKLIHKVRRVVTKKRLIIGGAAILSILLITNVTTFVIYRGKTYPNTQLNNTSVSSVSFNGLESRSQEIVNLPENITLKVDNKSTELSPGNLGITVDYAAVVRAMKASRSWLPVANLFMSHPSTGEYTVDSKKFEEAITASKADLNHEPANAMIQIKDADFIVIPQAAGKEVDLSKSEQSVISGLKSNDSSIELPTKETPSEISEDQLKDELTSLRSQIGTKITIKYGDKTITLSKTEIINLFAQNEDKWQPSSKKIGALIDAKAKEFGITVGNKKQASDAIASAVSSAKPVTVTLTAAPKMTKTYSYCVAAKGVDESNLGAFRSKLQAVYADARGWSLDGQVGFREVASGCNFTAWLTRADLVPSFSSTICDSTWSCRVGNNVIINFDRWTGASPSWNGAGGSLDEYRSMVINHETGHWFGFAHRYCGGAGQAAPVMQQQSINLQGCKFSAWPNASELASRRSSAGL